MLRAALRGMDVRGCGRSQGRKSACRTAETTIDNEGHNGVATNLELEGPIL